MVSPLGAHVSLAGRILKRDTLRRAGVVSDVHTRILVALGGGCGNGREGVLAGRRRASTGAETVFVLVRCWVESDAKSVRYRVRTREGYP